MQKGEDSNYHLQIGLCRQSLRDLWKLEDDLSLIAGEKIAANYVDAIVNFCASISQSPLRGEERPYVRPGLRTIGFRKRVAVRFRVSEIERTVTVARIMYAGRMH